MRNLPEPTHLEIGIDEWQVAQGNIEGVDVTVQWRGVREDPALVDLLAALPPAEPFVPITLVDGRTELAPQRWKTLRFGSGTSFFEAAQRDFEPWGKVWSSPSPLAKARRNVTNMIRRHLPHFDDYTDKEQIDFIVRTQDKVNKIRESVEALILHLEYAAPDKPNAVPPHKDPRADVQAAVFSAVMGGTRRAGELLDVPIPHSDADRHENQTVRKMANRGRELLRMHFGATEWKNMVERMRGYREWWEWYESVDDPKDQVYALLAKASGTSAEHERASAEEDGFDAILEEWIPVAEQRINVMDALDKSKDASEKDNLRREAKTLLDLQMSIQERDERFSRALSLFDAPPSDRP